MDKNKKLIIFGCADVGQLAHYYFTNDSEYEVAAFCLDPEYLEKMDEAVFEGLPVVAFDHKLREAYDPAEYEMFVALGYSGVNEARKQRYLATKDLGYQMASYISSQATVLNDGKIGDNAFILEDNTVQPFVTIGNNVTLWSGNHIGHHGTIGDHTFVSSHVVISGGVVIGEQCFLGVNATLRDRITVGDRTIVGAGAILLKDAEADGVYAAKTTDRSKLSSTRLKKI